MKCLVLRMGEGEVMEIVYHGRRDEARSRKDKGCDSCTGSTRLLEKMRNMDYK